MTKTLAILAILLGGISCLSMQGALPADSMSEDSAFFQIDLAPYANASLQDDTANDGGIGWTDQGVQDMRHLPSGMTSLLGIPFSLPDSPQDKAVIVLKGAQAPHRERAISGIVVNRRTATLYFLQACAWAARPDVMTCRVHYADGETLDIPFRLRSETGDWYSPSDYEHAKVGWVGMHPICNVRFGLYIYAWENPFPFSVIESIDMISCELAIPLVVAISGREPANDIQARISMEATPQKDGTLSLETRIALRSCGHFTIALEGSNEDGSPFMDTTRQEIIMEPGKNSARQTMVVPWPDSSVDISRRLHATLLDESGTAIADTFQWLAVSGTSQAAFKHRALDAAAPIGDDNIFYSAEVQPLICIHHKNYNKGVKPPRNLESLFESLAKNGATVAHLICWWSYLEPQPEQYDFSSIDWALEQCRKNGLKASISVWMSDHGVPSFLYDENMIDQKGRPMLGDRGDNVGAGYSVSLWGPKSRKYFGALIRKIVGTYLEDDTVASWGFMYQHTEVTIHDRLGKDIYLYDYSTFAEENFRRWLTEVKGLSLEAINQRYGTAYKDISEVRQPQPSDGLDVTPRWNDFQDFRIFSCRSIFEFVFQNIREMDPDGKKHAFVFNPSMSSDICKKYGIIVDATGSESKNAYNSSAYISLTNSPFIMEPTNIPPDIYELNAGFFNALSIPAQGYIWVGTGRNEMPTATAAALIYQRQRHAWERLSTATRVKPIMLLNMTDTLLAEEKIFTGFRALGPDTLYSNFIETLFDAQFAYVPVDDATAAYAGYELLPRTQLIIDFNGKVMRRGLIDHLENHVKNGGVLLISPQSGLYCRENPVSSESLAARFGWEIAAGAAFKPLQDAAQHIAGGLKYLQRYPIAMLDGTLLCDSSGEPYAIAKNHGKGKVIMLAGYPDWKNAVPALEHLLCEDCGIQREIIVQPGIRGAVTHKGRQTFVLLFNEESTHCTECCVKLPLLPDGSYRVRRVTNNDALEMETTAENWRNGHPIVLAPYELRVYELTPAEMEPSH